jgi:hypothetical protein
MLRKVSIGVAVILVLLVSGVVIFRDEAKSLAFAWMTEDMFLEEDLDDYDPGIAVIDAFPQIKVSMNGETYTDLRPFIGPRGLVVLFSRSVVW